ncbi:MAG: carboxymuconolactone decarboxylase family protein [Chromatiales bacterium]|nr:carboxymuconolactone decarboxylase family protein [Gammaproteobacteria bacterium]MBW6477485.1 carboxymuconolactone decarboxylase family protein [Chromatiales bacterium]
MNVTDLPSAFKKAREYGIGEYLELLGELSQESTKKGILDRKTKELITLGIALAKGCHRCISIHTEAARKMGAKGKALREVSKLVLFINASPGCDSVDLWDEWRDSWKSFSSAKGPLERAHRELIALGIALVRQQAPHIDLHTRAAIKHGADANAVFEVVPIALLMDGAPVLSQIPCLVDAIDQAQNDKSA